MEMALAAHSVPMFLHPLAYGVGNIEVPYTTENTTDCIRIS